MNLEAPTLKEFEWLQDNAWAVLESLRAAELSPDDALFVLLLALGKFIAVLPPEGREEVLESIHRMLAIAATSTDAEPDIPDIPPRRYHA